MNDVEIFLHFFDLNLAFFQNAHKMECNLIQKKKQEAELWIRIIFINAQFFLLFIHF